MVDLSPEHLTVPASTAVLHVVLVVGLDFEKRWWAGFMFLYLHTGALGDSTDRTWNV